MDTVAVIRAVVTVCVGGFLIVYAAVTAVPNRAVLVVLGLVLLGVITLDGIFTRHRP